MTAVFSQYKDSLGRPREGIHAARIPGLDVALWDVVGTICIAGGVAALAGWPIGKTILIALLLGVLAHALFGVRTRVHTLVS